VQGMLVGRLTKRVGEQKLAVSGLVIQGIAGLGMLIPAAFWQLYPLSILSSGSAGLIYPTMGALAANSVPLEEQGKVNGVSTALGSLMSVFGPLWAGAIYDGIAPTAPFWMGGVLFVLAGVLLARVTVTSAVGRTWPAQPVAE
ncbi:MAG: MFS transporter, partial [Chloroflexi bacterium]|nr:MFS transporter [Chloroflexota bacterium]